MGRACGANCGRSGLGSDGLRRRQLRGIGGWGLSRLSRRGRRQRRCEFARLGAGGRGRQILGPLQALLLLAQLPLLIGLLATLTRLRLATSLFEFKGLEVGTDLPAGITEPLAQLLETSARTGLHIERMAQGPPLTEIEAEQPLGESVGQREAQAHHQQPPAAQGRERTAQDPSVLRLRGGPGRGHRSSHHGLHALTSMIPLQEPSSSPNGRWIVVAHTNATNADQAGEELSKATAEARLNEHDIGATKCSTIFEDREHAT